MKRWLVIALMLVGLLHLIPKQAYQAQNNQGNASKSIQSGIPSDKGSTATGPSPQKEQNGSDNEADHSGWCERILAPIFNNWATLAVTVWGIFVLIDQTKATRIAAEAALLNSQAVINSERAWIVVTVQSSEAYIFEFLMENTGRTPARLVSSFCDISIMDRGDIIAPDPVYKTERLTGMQPLLFLPQQKRIIFKINMRELKGPRSEAQWMKEVQVGLHNIYFFGRVRYSDTLTLEKDGSPVIHETKWGFSFVPIPGALPLSDPYLVPVRYIDYT